MPKPYVFLCTAMSLDGKISSFDRRQAEIAEDDDREMLQGARAEADVVLIGAGQLRLDDPKLIVKPQQLVQERLSQGRPAQPIKAAVVSNLRTISKRYGDFFSTGERRILFTTERTSKADMDRFRNLAEVHVYGDRRVELSSVMEKLHDIGARKVMVEGGGELIFSLLKEGLVDEIRLKIGNLILGGRDTATLVDGDGFTQETAKRVRITEAERKGNCLILKCMLK